MSDDALDIERSAISEPIEPATGAQVVAAVVLRKYSFEDMWDVCAGLAADIETGQGALVKAGIRVAPAECQMHRVRVLDAVCLTMQILMEIGADDFRAYVGRARQERRRRGGGSR